MKKLTDIVSPATYDLLNQQRLNAMKRDSIGVKRYMLKGELVKPRDRLHAQDLRKEEEALNIRAFAKRNEQRRYKTNLS